jgi:regulatory protein
MPDTISRIEQQKKNKKRFSLYVENQYLMGVSEETLLKFNIYQGRTISDEETVQIQNHEEKIAVREQAWRYLSRRAHSTKELSDKLLKKGLNKDTVEHMIFELKEKQYIDDDAFARQWISDEITLKKSGPLLIKNKLLQKGITSDKINQLLIDLYDEQQQRTNCRQLVQKKVNFLNQQKTADKKNKLYRFLTQKGYTWEIINPVLSGILGGEENGVE